MDLPCSLEPPDLRRHREVHDALRVAAGALVEALRADDARTPDRAAALRRWFDGLAAGLHAHLHAEDHIVFPALAVRVPAFAAHRGLLGSDHARLRELTRAVADWLRDLANGSAPAPEVIRTTALARAVELRAALEAHLDVEETDVLPLIERNISRLEWAAIEQRADITSAPAPLPPSA